MEEQTSGITETNISLNLGESSGENSGGWFDSKKVQLGALFGIIFALAGVFILMAKTGKRGFWWIILFWLIGGAIGNRLGYFLGGILFKE
jgi:lipoprotein signal peptidase